LICALLTILCSPFLTPAIAVGQSPSQGLEIPTTPHGFNIVIDNINMTNIADHVKVLSAQSRFTGYPGFFEAANYIASKFEEYGLQPYGDDGTYYEYFNITTPIDHGTFLMLDDGRKIKAYMFYPNLVNPCPYESPEYGDTLVYLGRGEFEDFAGLNITGKFVLMDFASKWHFYLAMAGGAKGVIFVPETPELLIRSEAEQKEVFIPVPFPRLYVRLEDGGEELVNLARKHRQEGIKVRISANMTWENVRIANVVGYIPGKDSVLSKQIIVISAYYDSWSIVPALSYGATDCLGVSDLLEIARYLSTHRPDRSVLIVGLAGHYQGLWGAREFVEKHFAQLQSEIIAFAGMDLSSGSDQIGVYATGSAYTYQRADILYPTRYSWLVGRMFQNYLTEMKMVLGASYGENFVDGTLGSHPGYIASVRPLEPRIYGYFSILSGSTPYYQSLSFLFDSDPFVLAMYANGFTYHTSNDLRLYQRTPADTWKKINFENVLTQVMFVHCTLWAFINEDEIRVPTKSRLQDDWGYVELTVEVTEYNMLTDFHDPFNSTRHPDLWQDVIVFFQSAYPAGLRVATKIDEEGKAVIHGLKPYQTGIVDAFIIDRKTGKVTWSTDFGVWQAPGGPLVPMTKHPQTKAIRIFPCASIAIIFAFNPGDFRFLRMGMIYNAIAHGPMIRANGLGYDTYFMLFVMPNVPTEVLFSMGERWPVVVLNSADPENPNGKGYVLDQGETLILGPDEIVRNMRTMILSRYDKLYSYHTYTPTMQIFHQFVSKYLYLWDDAFASEEFQRVVGYSYFSWTFLLGLYGSVMDLTWQVILTLSVLFTITIPFSMVIERLVFGFSGKNRFFVIVLLVVASNLAFYFFHPGFTIANSSPLVLVTASLLVILAPLLSLIINETRASATSLRGKVRGASHFSEISRSGLFSASMSMSIENMKKRRFRTILTLLSVVLIIFGMVCLSSVTITPQLISGAGGIGNPSSFSGMIIRATPWVAINEGTYTILKSSLSGLADVVPRSYLYPPPQPLRVTQPGVPIPYIVFSPKMQTRIYGVMALSHEEPKVSNIDKLLTAGTWFLENDVYAAILPGTVASSLSDELGMEIGPGSNISLWGLTLQVRGIIDASGLNDFYNPDGERITPIDPTAPTTAITPPHFAADNVFIIPYSLFSRIVYITPLATIAIKPVNNTVSDTLLKELPFQLAYRIYVADEGELGYFLLSKQWLGVLGYQYLIVPILIASFAILNLMLGSVYERTKEIAVYNAIGMSPLHISLSFIVEAISYALPAIFSGYLAGLIMTATLIGLGTYPKDLYPNFSSFTVLIVLGLGLAVTAVSAVYPSVLAARLAVPSRVRRWQKSISKPKGDYWEVAIPLIVNTEDEVFGVYNYLREYLSFSMQRESLFTAEKIDVKELKEGEMQILRLIADCRLAPYDLGIKSDIIMEGVRPNREAPFTFKLTLQRTAGYASTWRTSCPSVADEIRKQVLIWRTLTPEERGKYIKLGEKPGEG